MNCRKPKAKRKILKQQSGVKKKGITFKRVTGHCWLRNSQWRPENSGMTALYAERNYWQSRIPNLEKINIQYFKNQGKIKISDKQKQEFFTNRLTPREILEGDRRNSSKPPEGLRRAGAWGRYWPASDGATREGVLLFLGWPRQDRTRGRTNKSTEGKNKRKLKMTNRNDSRRWQSQPQI